MGLVLHHLNDSRSHRLVVLLEELGLPFELVTHARTKERQAPEDMRRIHPLGKAPILVDDGEALVETGAIFEHLLDRHGEGRLEPERGGAEWRRYRQFMHSAEGSLMPVLYLSIVFTSSVSQAPLFTGPVVFIVSTVAHHKYIDPQIGLQLGYVERELGSRPWIAGEAFTAADVMMSYPLEVAEARGHVGAGSRIADWLRRYRARPSFAKASALLGPQDYAYGNPNRAKKSGRVG